MPKRDVELDPFVDGVRGQESVRKVPDFGPVVECSAEEDRARQEYKLQSDLAYQVQRFGVGAHPVYGSVDFDNLDLTRALEIVERSREEWAKLPAVVRERYGSWAAVERAHRSGELEQVLKAAGAAEVPSAALAASPSDSAAGDGRPA